MALCYRVGSQRLRPVTRLLSTRLSGDLPSAPAPPPVPAAAPRLPFFGQLRSFAAPVQAKSKEKPSESGSSAGPRVNEAITAPVVRLVTEDGHNVVSLREALDRAKQLDLDLVEVQRAAKPPVCKIMDFHKEKYKKETMEKERAKTKSALSLKSGEKKEVRFKAKTELKDLKVKADGITRLMERGYRVKCTALPSGTEDGKKTEEERKEDLGSHLSRLLALIEDVSFIESGPHLDPKQAYAIVRHIKFETKKSGKKKVADIPKASLPLKTAEKADEKPAEEPDEEWECDSESDDVTLTNLKNEEIPEMPVANFGSVNEFDRRSALGSVKEEPLKAINNRYAARTEPQKVTSSSQSISPNNIRDYNGRESSFNQGRFPPGNPSEFKSRDAFNNGRIAPGNTRDFNYRDGFNQDRVAVNNYRDNNSRGAFNQDRIAMNNFWGGNSRDAFNREHNAMNNFRGGNSGDGFNREHNAMNNFQSSNSRDAFNQGRGQFHNREMPFQNSNQNFRPPNLGQFRNEGPPPDKDPSNNPNTPPKPKFGIFNISKKSTESSENTGSSDSNSPMPKFGIFSANRTDAPNNQR